MDAAAAAGGTLDASTEIAAVELLHAFTAASPARGVAVCPATGSLFATCGHRLVRCAIKDSSNSDASGQGAPGAAACGETQRPPGIAVLRRSISASYIALVAAAAPAAAAAPMPQWAASSDEEDNTAADTTPLWAASSDEENAGDEPAVPPQPPPSTDAAVLHLVAGGQEHGCRDGPPAAARFNHPAGLAVSPDGRWIVVCDYWNNRLASVELPDATVRTLLGDVGDGSAAGSVTCTPGGRDGRAHHRLLDGSCPPAEDHSVFSINRPLFGAIFFNTKNWYILGDLWLKIATIECEIGRPKSKRCSVL